MSCGSQCGFMRAAPEVWRPVCCITCLVCCQLPECPDCRACFPASVWGMLREHYIFDGIIWHLQAHPRARVMQLAQAVFTLGLLSLRTTKQKGKG